MGLLGLILLLLVGLSSTILKYCMQLPLLNLPVIIAHACITLLNHCVFHLGWRYACLPASFVAASIARGFSAAITLSRYNIARMPGSAVFNTSIWAPDVSVALVLYRMCMPTLQHFYLGTGGKRC